MYVFQTLFSELQILLKTIIVKIYLLLCKEWNTKHFLTEVSCELKINSTIY